MIQRRYQYWGPGAKITWTSWFNYDTHKTISELNKEKPVFKKLLEEYREI